MPRLRARTSGMREAPGPPAPRPTRHTGVNPGALALAQRRAVAQKRAQIIGLITRAGGRRAFTLEQNRSLQRMMRNPFAPEFIAAPAADRR